MPDKKKSVTLKDIANATGVTPGTVSFVLTNTYKKRRVSEETAERVRRSARELGYLPNIAARNLREEDPRKRRLVLSIITSTGSPLTLVSHIFEALQRRIQTNASSRQIVINIATFDPGNLRDLPGLLSGSYFNGAIITNTVPEDDAFLESTELPYPTLVIGREIQGYSCFVPSVNAGKVAFQMLSSAGCRRPVVLSEKRFTQAVSRRITDFTEAFSQEWGIPVQRILAGYPSEQQACEAVDAFLRDGGTVDGLFCVHDNLAAGAYLALRRYSLSIPEQVKVIGMGDSDWAGYLQPPLSCAGAEEGEVYDKAAEMILNALASPSRAPEIVRTFARIISRGSV